MSNLEKVMAAICLERFFSSLLHLSIMLPSLIILTLTTRSTIYPALKKYPTSIYLNVSNRKHNRFATNRVNPYLSQIIV